MGAVLHLRFGHSAFVVSCLACKMNWAGLRGSSQVVLRRCLRSRKAEFSIAPDSALPDVFCVVAGSRKARQETFNRQTCMVLIWGRREATRFGAVVSCEHCAMFEVVPLAALHRSQNITLTAYEAPPMKHPLASQNTNPCTACCIKYSWTALRYI